MTCLIDPKQEYKRQMAEYIAFIFRTCDHKVPRNIGRWVIIVPDCSSLSEFSSILGYPIYVVSSLDGVDFKLSIPADEEENRKFIKAFDERQREVIFREDCNYDV